MASQIQWTEGRVKRAVRKGMRKGLKTSGALVARKAKEKCPVGMEEKFVAKKGMNASQVWTARIPGTLKKSIRYKIVKKGTKVQVIAGGRSASKLTAYYAMWVEFGTKDMIAYPFLRPAIESSYGEIEAAFADQVDD